MAGEIVYGDINYDGKISATDLATMRQAILGEYALSAAEKEIFDLNGDGNVSEADEDLLTQFVLKEITIFPVELMVAKINIEKLHANRAFV